MSDNPLKQILTGEQFNELVKFYDADQKLDHSDRVALATQLQSLAIKANLVGYTSGMVGFFLPTAYIRLFNRPTPTPFFFIQMPFISLILGFGTLLAGNSATANYCYKKVAEDPKALPNAPTHQMWNLMKNQNLGAFTLYYSRTAVNPMYIIRDPRLATNDSYIDERLKGKSNLHFSQGASLGTVDQSGKNHDLSLLDKVKLHHGFEVK
ncbi:uncharacterized protein LODBEIA_P55240 [Lodderomyces beijingensis]|uniref:Transmembrane protein n=1 Tax=Lodderomyces beijingensis TaxID=1775926 RepID=A0ABP0ZVF3_9ASCO